MHALIYDSYFSAIQSASDSVTLRCAILLSEEFTFAGSRYGILDFENWYRFDKTESQVVAIEFLNNILGNKYDYATNNQVKKIRNFNLRKGKSNKEIIAFKQYENATREIYDSLKAEVVEKFKVDGLINLRPLLSEKYFHVLYNDISKPEVDDEINGLTPVSQMLTLEKKCLDKEEEFNEQLQSVFFLQDEFSAELKKPITTSTGEIKSFGETNIYSHKLFTLPNLNYANANEISSIRNFIKPAIKNFHLQINQWLSMAYPGNNDAESFLTSTLLPVCMELQKHIDGNEIIQHLNLHNDYTSQIEIYATEVLLPDVWNFYEYFQAISKVTIDTLEKKKIENVRYSKKFPVLTVHGTKRIPRENSAANEEEIKPVKKNLSLD